MYSTTEKEKEFLNKNVPKTLDDFSKLSDRELLERQTLYLSTIRNSNERIKANLQFWFYFAIAALLISLLFFMSN